MILSGFLELYASDSRNYINGLSCSDFLVISSRHLSTETIHKNVFLSCLSIGWSTIDEDPRRPRRRRIKGSPGCLSANLRHVDAGNGEAGGRPLSVVPEKTYRSSQSKRFRKVVFP